jgi:hypothetical protein
MQGAMSEETVLLKDVLKKLGYGDDKSLSDWMQNIMQNKEDFRKRYIPPKCRRTLGSGERERNTYVFRSAEVFIENLCILNRYITLFPRRSQKDTDWGPFKYIITEKKDEKQFKKNAKN